MKAKVKLDMDKVKEFGKEHGEKFVLAFFVLILGVFIVKAASRETLPDNLQPDKIVARSQEADRKIKGEAVPPPAQDVKNVDLSGVGKELGVGLQGFDAPELSKPPIEDPVKRVDPTLMAVEELRVYSIRGGVPTNPTLGAGPLGRGRGPVPAIVPPTGGLVPGRGPAARPSVRGPAGRPAATPAPTIGLIGGAAANAAPAELPYPADFHPPGPQGCGAAQGHYAIVVTGLIPVQAQREEYDRRFKNARRGVMAEGGAGAGRGRDRAEIEGDSPKYVWTWLERTDTTNGKIIVLDFGDTEEVVHAVQQSDEKLRADTKKQVKELGISPLTRKKLEAEEYTWCAPGGEVVDKDYLAEKWFTWPLPPILLHDWGAEAAHLPKIPLAVPVGMAAPGDAQPGQPTPAGDNIFSSDKPDAAGGPSPMRRHERGGGLGGNAIVATEVPYKLFRFVDLDVEPGHAYQYRVQMMLRNPNFGLEQQVLLKPETASVAYRQTPWSEKSPTAIIPQDTRLLGGTIDRPPHKEPKAKISVFTFDKEQAIELIKEFETELGALVGTTVADQTVKGVADPVVRQIHDIKGNFRTPSVLLDFRGNDEKLAGANGPTNPAEMLLLDNIDDPENPRLIVVNEAKDKPTIDEWKKTHEAPTANVVPAPAPGKAPVPAPARGNGLIPGGGLIPPRTGSPTRRPAGR